MKAIVWIAYGAPDVLQLQDVKKPEPKDNEVLIKIHAATVTAGDCEARSLRFPRWIRLPMRIYMGWRKPTRVKILGMELAGEIEAVGKEVTRFQVGDRVMAITDMSFGAYAEYKCMAEHPTNAAIAPIPNNLPLRDAAALPLGGLESVHFLKSAGIQPGETILINGAGGSIGTAGIQIAKHWGAEVTAVDSTPKLEMLRSLGADHVIDYTQEDFTDNGQTYDVIFDVVGKGSFGRIIHSLNKHGHYLLANPTPSKMIRGLWTSKTSSKRVIFETAHHALEDLLFLKELCELGVFRPIIDRRYPLAQTAEAHRYVDTGRKAGNVIITVLDDSKSGG